MQILSGIVKIDVRVVPAICYLVVVSEMTVIISDSQL